MRAYQKTPHSGPLFGETERRQVSPTSPVSAQLFRLLLLSEGLLYLKKNGIQKQKCSFKTTQRGKNLITNIVRTTREDSATVKTRATCSKREQYRIKDEL
jgi:hypothetical protein